MLSNHHQIVDSIDIEPSILFRDNNELFHYLTSNKKEYYKINNTGKPEVINSRDVFRLSLELLSKLIKDDLIFSKKNNWHIL